MRIERAALVVVTTKDGTSHNGCLTAVVIVDIRFIDIARRQNLCTVGTTIDAVHLDGGGRRYIDDGTCRHTLVETAAIDVVDIAMQQVDDGRELVAGEIVLHCGFYVKAHTQTIVCTRTEYLGINKFVSIIGDIDEHVTAILCFVTLAVSGITSTTTEDTRDVVTSMILRTDVHERVG